MDYEALGGSGYEFVCLRKNNKHHNKRIHQLVAEHFIFGKKDGLVNGEQSYKIANEFGVTRNDITVLCKIIALTGEELILLAKK